MYLHLNFDYFMTEIAKTCRGHPRLQGKSHCHFVHSVDWMKTSLIVGEFEEEADD